MSIGTVKTLLRNTVYKEEKIMSMLDWAKREIEIASKRERGDKPEGEWDYGCACYDSAYKAFKSLCEDGHSGYSIGVTKHILNRLIDGKPLTPIEDKDEVWNLWHEDDKGMHYQCKRMSSLFKDVAKDGTVSYSDINRYYCVSKDNPMVSWHNGFVHKIYSELYPLTMPYMPTNRADEVVCAELLTDPKNGDYDTLAILYINRANGERVEVNRYFKEGETSFVEISLEEYKVREAMDRDREERLAKAESEAEECQGIKE